MKRKPRSICQRFGDQIITILGMAIISLIVVLLISINSEQNYIFNVSANSSYFDVEITGDAGLHHWRVNDAIICSQENIDLEVYEEGNQSKPCGNWKSYLSSDPELTLTIEKNCKAIFEVGADGALRLALRSGRNKKSVVNLTINQDRTVPLSAKTNLVWLPEITNKRHADYLIFPFTGKATIGNDVSYSSHGILTRGDIYVYTSDFFSATKRKLIDQIKLLVGDKVIAGDSGSSVDNNSKKVPKGFVRFDQRADHPELQAVSFGEAGQIRIVRYGDYGINFKPPLLSRLINDPWLVFLTAVIAIFSVFAALMQIYGSQRSHNNRGN